LKKRRVRAENISCKRKGKGGTEKRKWKKEMRYKRQGECFIVKKGGGGRDTTVFGRKKKDGGGKGKVGVGGSISRIAWGGKSKIA